jgi:hypothetical protein
MAGTQGLQSNSDGGQVTLGLTARILKWLNGTITMTGGGTSNITFPQVTDTMAVIGTAQTFTAAQTFAGTLISAAGQIVKTRVVTAAGAVTVATTDYVIIVNKTTGAATTVNLPASPATGLTFVIKDGKADAATNNITITPAAGNIVGSSSSTTYVMNSNGQSAKIVYDGTQWNVI